MIFHKVAAKDLVKAIESTVLAARQSSVRDRQDLLLDVRHDRLNVTGVGAQVEVDVLTDVPVYEASKSFSINAASLMDVLSHLPKEASVSVRYEDDVLKLQAGRSRFRMRTLPGKDFLRFAAQESQIQQSITVDGRALVAAIKLVMPAVAVGDVRHYLNGVLFDVSPGMLMVVGTDGHRLHRVCLPLLGSETPAMCIVPREVARDIFTRTLDAEQVLLDVRPTLLTANVGSARIRSKLIEGRFPDVKRFFANELGDGMEIDRQALVGMLERASLVYENAKKAPGVQLKVAADALIAHATHDGDVFDESIDCSPAEGTKGMEGTEVAFNIGYLLDSLKQISAERLSIGVSSFSVQ